MPAHIPRHLAALRDRYQQTLQRYPRRTMVLTALIMLGLSALWAALWLALLVWLGAFGPLPDYATLKNLRQEEASIVYSADGQQLGLLYRTNRIVVEADEVPPVVTQALVATEDARFFRHTGIDLVALGRVLVKSILLRDESAGGGSTLTQQLAKNLFPRRDYGLLSLPINKLREMFIARRLEQLYDKEALLLMYLNTVPFGHQAWGIRQAAWRYFGKQPAALKTEEAATLIGLLKGTSHYDPVAHPERARQRRNAVLHRMRVNGYLDSLRCDSLCQLPLQVDYHAPDADQLAPWLVEQVRRQAPALLEESAWNGNRPYDIYTDGLRIYTTIDSRLQRLAEASVRSHLPRLQRAFWRDWGRRNPVPRKLLWQVARLSPRYQALRAQGHSRRTADSLMQHLTVPVALFDQEAPGRVRYDTLSPLDSVAWYLQILHAGMLAVDPATGAVKVWVGGIDWQFFKYDQVRANRQTGSLFKPLVYAAAIERGWRPCDYLPVQEAGWPQPDGTVWRPRNAHHEPEGLRSLSSALTRSTNTIAARLLYEVGLEAVREKAELLGMAEVPATPAIALGTASASLLEMTAACAAILNEGLLPPLWFIERIETRHGDTLYLHPPIDRDLWPRLMSDTAAFTLNQMLQAVVDDTAGTAHSLRTRFGLTMPLIGKTGTTQHQADGWFVAATPRLVVGARTGHEYPAVHWRTMRGQAAATALPLVGDFLYRVQRSRHTRPWTSGMFPLMYPGESYTLDCPPWLPDSSWIPWVRHPLVPEVVLRQTIEAYKQWRADSLMQNLPFLFPWDFSDRAARIRARKKMERKRRQRQWRRFF